MVALPSVDAFALARAQLVRDAIATRQFPRLFAHKRARMLPSAHGLLRGSAPLFYDLLAADPALAPGPDPQGWIVGDMHVENVGIYRSESNRTRFDIDDFDEATHGPLRFDVLRAATSMLLTARDLGASPRRQIRTGATLLAAYAERMQRADGDAAPLPTPFDRAVRAVARRHAAEVLRHRVERSDGHARFVRSPTRYLELPEALRQAAPRLLQGYYDALGDRAPRQRERTVIEDAAQRVAGTGNLGHVRIAYVLRRGDRLRLVELKQCHGSAVDRAWSHPPAARGLHDAARVVEAATRLPRQPARRLAAVLDAETGLSLLGRRLVPQQDKLDATTLTRGRLGEFARVVGERLGAAHMRGSDEPAALVGWLDASLREALLDGAIRMASIHEAIHLAYARLAPDFDPRPAREAAAAG
ncbi:MAG: DUF2252 domain-containing protein [Nannocystaceae bacterium]|nr:DUF2252 domain-containing protein [Nannocystaceae bacterium]